MDTVYVADILRFLRRLLAANVSRSMKRLVILWTCLRSAFRRFTFATSSSSSSETRPSPRSICYSSSHDAPQALTICPSIVPSSAPSPPEGSSQDNQIHSISVIRPPLSPRPVRGFSRPYQLTAASSLGSSDGITFRIEADPTECDDCGSIHRPSSAALDTIQISPTRATHDTTPIRMQLPPSIARRSSSPSRPDPCYYRPSPSGLLQAHFAHSSSNSTPNLTIPGHAYGSSSTHPYSHSLTAEPFLRPSSAASSSSRVSIGRSSYKRYPGPRPATPNVVRSHERITSSTPTLAGCDFEHGPTVLTVSPARLVAPPLDGRPADPYTTSYPSERVLQPISASSVGRYERNVVIAADVACHVIRALTTEYHAHHDTLPPGWTAHVHPEGVLFYFNERKRIYTEVNVCDQEIFDDITEFSNRLYNELDMHRHQGYISLADDSIELVLEPRLDADNNVMCCYYFVNVRDQSLFWLSDYDAHDFLEKCRGVWSMSHIIAINDTPRTCHSCSVLVSDDYLLHWTLFPNMHRVTEELVSELRDMIQQAECDHLTSNQSAAAFSAPELRNFSIMLKDLRIDDPKHTGYSAWTVGRLMYSFSQNHFLNFRGQEGARLNFDQTVHGRDLNKRSLTMTVLSPLLFRAPEFHLRALNKIFVDHIASTLTWNRFTERLNNELQDFNLLATVLLNANVGFLAIQSVDDGHARSPTSMASYLSVVASFGSIVLGLMLVRHNRTKGRDTASEAAKFLCSMHDERYGLETLAIVYSLPYALLMWGMVFFLMAFSLECYAPSLVFGYWISRVFVICASTIVLGLIYWCIVTANSEKTEEASTVSRLHRLFPGRLFDARQTIPQSTECTDLPAGHLRSGLSKIIALFRPTPRGELPTRADGLRMTEVPSVDKMEKPAIVIRQPTMMEDSGGGAVHSSAAV